MKKVNTEKIKAELEKGFGKKTMRNGIEYAWYNAGALDEGIKTRARNARKWREAVLELTTRGEVYEEKITVGPEYSRIKVKATAYVLNGADQFYVYRGKMISTDSYIRKGESVKSAPRYYAEVRVGNEDEHYVNQVVEGETENDAFKNAVANAKENSELKDETHVIIDVFDREHPDHGEWCIRHEMVRIRK